MLSPKKILFAGCGDLALGCMSALQQHQITAIARKPKPVPAGVTFWQGDITSDSMGAALQSHNWDAVVITFSPDVPADAASTDKTRADAYKQAYWINTQYILHKLTPLAKPLVVFVSSTSVYAQDDGGWIDESSLAEPITASGRWLLATEQLVSASGFPHCNLRLAGLYGPGRDYLLRQVRAGQAGDEAFTNRIHRDDACGLINFLVNSYFAGQQVPSILLGSDDEPVSGCVVRRWLAAAMGLPPLEMAANSRQADASSTKVVRGGNKRCSNALAHQLGYQFLYPDYRKGYAHVLANLEK